MLKRVVQVVMIFARKVIILLTFFLMCVPYTECFLCWQDPEKKEPIKKQKHTEKKKEVTFFTEHEAIEKRYRNVLRTAQLFMDYHNHTPLKNQFAIIGKCVALVNTAFSDALFLEKQDEFLITLQWYEEQQRNILSQIKAKKR